MLCRTTSKLARLQEYLAVANLPDLTDAEEKEIDDVGSTVHHRAFVSARLTHSCLIAYDADACVGQVDRRGVSPVNLLLARGSRSISRRMYPYIKQSVHVLPSPIAVRRLSSSTILG